MWGGGGGGGGGRGEAQPHKQMKQDLKSKKLEVLVAQEKSKRHFLRQVL